MDYLDFEIDIGIGEGRIYPVVVVRSAAGEARETMHCNYSGALFKPPPKQRSRRR